MKSLTVWLVLLLYLIPGLFYETDDTTKLSIIPEVALGFIFNLDRYNEAFNSTEEVNEEPKIMKDTIITPMESLDKVKSIYGDNFVKVYYGEREGDYYYKLPIADYYLVFEGIENDQIHYLYHLYEFVLDDKEEGIGHMVTYGWYVVNRYTGALEALLVD